MILPTTIFVRWEDLPNDKPGLDAKVYLEEHAALGESRVVGKYQLVEVSEVATEIRKTPVPLGTHARVGSVVRMPEATKGGAA